MINPKDPAFPISNLELTQDGKLVLNKANPGMDIRTKIAAMAMQGLLSAGNRDPEYISLKAIEYADALIDRLNKEG